MRKSLFEFFLLYSNYYVGIFKSEKNVEIGSKI